MPVVLLNKGKPGVFGVNSDPVSYTHLDVYKRQIRHNVKSVLIMNIVIFKRLETQGYKFTRLKERRNKWEVQSILCQWGN